MDDKPTFVTCCKTGSQPWHQQWHCKLGGGLEQPTTKGLLHLHVLLHFNPILLPSQLPSPPLVSQSPPSPPPPSHLIHLYLLRFHLHLLHHHPNPTSSPLISMSTSSILFLSSTSIFISTLIPPHPPPPLPPAVAAPSFSRHPLPLPWQRYHHWCSWCCHHLPDLPPAHNHHAGTGSSHH